MKRRLSRLLLALLLPTGACKAGTQDVAAGTPDGAEPPVATAPPATAPSATAPSDPAEPARPLHLLGGDAAPLTLPDGRRAIAYGPIFLGNDLRDTPGPLQLRLEGVHAEPGSAAEVYLQNNDGTELFDPADYLGSVAVMHGAATPIPQVVLEVHDFQVDGEPFTARSTLRTLASFGVVFVFLDGHITVDRLTLMVPPARDAQTWQVLEHGTHRGVAWALEQATAPDGTPTAQHQLRIGDQTLPVDVTERGLLTTKTFGFRPDVAGLAAQLIEHDRDYSPLPWDQYRRCETPPVEGEACSEGFCPIPGDFDGYWLCEEGGWRWITHAPAGDAAP